MLWDSKHPNRRVPSLGHKIGGGWADSVWPGIWDGGNLALSVGLRQGEAMARRQCVHTMIKFKSLPLCGYVS